LQKFILQTAEKKNMYLFETSKDVLNMVLAVSIGSIAFFVCWGSFYLVMSLRQLFKISKDIKETTQDVREAIFCLKSKIKSGAFLASLATDAVKSALEKIKDKAKAVKKTVKTKSKTAKKKK